MARYIEMVDNLVKHQWLETNYKFTEDVNISKMRNSLHVFTAIIVRSF